VAAGRHRGHRVGQSPAQPSCSLAWFVQPARPGALPPPRLCLLDVQLLHRLPSRRSTKALRALLSAGGPHASHSRRGAVTRHGAEPGGLRVLPDVGTAQAQPGGLGQLSRPLGSIRHAGRRGRRVPARFLHPARLPRWEKRRSRGSSAQERFQLDPFPTAAEPGRGDGVGWAHPPGPPSATSALQQKLSGVSPGHRSFCQCSRAPLPPSPR